MDGALKPPELQALEEIIAAAGGAFNVTRHESAAVSGAETLPVYAITLGTGDPSAPAAGFFAGVHGLERIGTRVILSFLRGIVARLAWDETLHRQLETMRLVFMPLANPGGMLRSTRANPAGVDLMRNSPVDAADPVPFLLGGQRISSGLPWYRGRMGEPMQPESRALCDTVQRELLARPFSIALDCHSGFGMRDRLWFPFAGRRAPFPGLAALHAMHAIFEETHTHHVYVIEPQSAQYLAHGDLWDHLVQQAGASRVFLPLTLEMGSWLWVKKNPRQFFSLRGLFNPLVEHREQRVLRRHWPLLDFVVRAAMSAPRWLPATHEEGEKHRRLALDRWYSQ
jgi:hypothetical protein